MWVRTLIEVTERKISHTSAANTFCYSKKDNDHSLDSVPNIAFRCDRAAAKLSVLIHARVFMGAVGSDSQERTHAIRPWMRVWAVLEYNLQSRCRFAKPFACSFSWTQVWMLLCLDSCTERKNSWVTGNASGETLLVDTQVLTSLSCKLQPLCWLTNITRKKETPFWVEGKGMHKRAFESVCACSSLLYASYLVDPASSHMLVSKIKPCTCKYKQLCTVKLQMAH